MYKSIFPAILVLIPIRTSGYYNPWVSNVAAHVDESIFLQHARKQIFLSDRHGRKNSWEKETEFVVLDRPKIGTRSSVAKSKASTSQVQSIYIPLIANISEFSNFSGFQEAVQSTKPIVPYSRLIILAISTPILLVILVLLLYSWRNSDAVVFLLRFGVACMFCQGPVLALCFETFAAQKVYLPFLWTMGVMLGKSCCVPLHFAYKRMSSEGRGQGQIRSCAVPFWDVLGITFLDLVAVTAFNVTQSVFSSVFLQILWCVKVPCGYILCRKILHVQFDWYQTVGAGIAAVSFTFALLPGNGHTPSLLNDYTGNQKWAIVATCTSLAAPLASSAQYIYERKAMDSYDLSPMLITGVEGVIGTPISLILTLIANTMGFEDSLEGVIKLVSLGSLLMLVFAFIAFAGMFSLSGAVVSKHASPLFRTIMDVTILTVAFVLKLCLGEATLSFREFVPFAIATCGALVYVKLFSAYTVPASTSQPLASSSGPPGKRH